MGEKIVMVYRHCFRAVVAALLFAVVPAGNDRASAVPSRAIPVRTPPVADAPLFSVNDNYLTYSYLPRGADPGMARKRKSSFTHSAISTCGLRHELRQPPVRQVGPQRSRRSLRQLPCPVERVRRCGRVAGPDPQHIGWNEIFNTHAFAIGPLHGVSFEAGTDATTKDNFQAPGRRDVVAGLQFAFTLPYKGYFNLAPLFYQEWNHNSFLTPAFTAPYPGIPGGSTHYNPTWAVEINDYMDLGFLPPGLQYFAVSGRAGFYGPKGTGAAPGVVAPYYQTKTETRLNRFASDSTPAKRSGDRNIPNWSRCSSPIAIGRASSGTTTTIRRTRFALPPASTTAAARRNRCTRA